MTTGMLHSHSSASVF